MAALESKVAIVTGGGRGLGRQAALELARHGATVVVNDIGAAVDGTGGVDATPAQSVVELITGAGGTAVAHVGDAGSWSDAEELVGSTVERFGRLDVLMNNAGILRRGPLIDLEEDDYDALMHAHLKATMAMTNHAGRHWRTVHAADPESRGSIVNMTSRAGLEPDLETLTWYGAAKAGIALATLGAAAQLGAFGVRVNAIAPFGPSRMALYTFDYETPAAEIVEADGALDDSNVAPLVAWLATDEANSITGEVFRVTETGVTRYRQWTEIGVADHPGRWDIDRVGHEITRLVSEG